MKQVADILRTKGHAVWCTQPDSSVFDALKLMAEKDVGALVVTEGTRPVGIFSERDYARKVILAGRTSPNTRVREIMSDKVIYVQPETTIPECMALMTQERIRHLPVIVNDELVGVVSIGDVVKDIITDQDMEIRQLENYVLGRGYSADPLQL